MRSLSTKLALAFLLTSLVGIALAALFVRQLVTSEFNTYVLNQRRDAFTELVTSYYVEHQSWQGIETIAFVTSPPPEPADAPPDNDVRRPLEFILADANGTIILAANPNWRGQPARAEDLQRGMAILIDQQQVGTVITPGEFAWRNRDEERYLARTDLALLAAAVVASIAALGLGLLLAQLITRPVRDLTGAVKAMAGGELRQQVPVRSRDELGTLAVQFNAMSYDLHRANELRRRMTADIAHDLRTPLTVISGYLEALRDETLRPTPERFAAMHDETQVLLRLVEDLHTLSQADAGELTLRRQVIAPARLIERVAATYSDAAAVAGVTLELQTQPGTPELLVDVEQLARAVSNLVSNALRHTPDGGRVSISARQAEGLVALEVADTGAGIAPEHLPNIFERFYRADASRQQASGGSGLGLAIVRSIVQAHGGRVEARSAVGQGAVFTILLPTQI